jgi:hypothetical protein
LGHAPKGFKLCILVAKFCAFLLPNSVHSCCQILCILVAKFCVFLFTENCALLFTDYTIEQGDQFESRSYNLIRDTINSGQLGLISSHCRLYKKKAYYSQKRKGDIIFDLTIEVWPPGAERFILLYIIECKGLKNKVPVDDIEEFHNKIDQISELNTKGVFITNKGFQKGAYNIAEATGMMLIILDYDDSHQILFHNIHRSKTINKNQNWDDTIETILTEAFDIHTKIGGLKNLTTEQLEQKAKEIIEECDPDILDYFKPLPLEKLKKFMKDKYQLSIEFNKSLGMNIHGQDILGYFNRKDNKIFIDESIYDTRRFPFVFAHELGHFFLHRELK